MKKLARTGIALAISGTLLACGQKQPAESAEQPSSPPPLTDIASAEQTAPAPTATESAGSPADATGDAPAAAAGTPTPSDAAPADALTDEQIATVTSLANNSEIEQAKLARARSKDEKVLQFAGMMIAHHGEAQRKQDALSLGSAESTLSRDMIVKSSETLKTLKEKTGAEFDRAYMQAQVQGHQKVLDAIEGKLLPNAKRADLKAYLDEIRPRVKQHLEQAERTVSALASRAAPSVAASK